MTKRSFSIRYMGCDFNEDVLYRVCVCRIYSVLGRKYIIFAILLWKNIFNCSVSLVVWLLAIVFELFAYYIIRSL